ncbi:MAG: hypothetical protein GY842_17045 [bacterium]|nr:hypothetical protein [bacterium]
MTVYRPHTPAPRRAWRHALFALAAVLAIGGATFAATGGVEKIKQWFVTIEIDDQTIEFVTEDAVNTFTVDTEHGPAEIQVEMSSSPEDGEMQTIQVRTELGAGEEVEKLVTRKCKIKNLSLPASDAVYTLEDIGDAAAAAEWEKDDLQNSVYLIPNSADEGDGFKVFLATTDAEENTTVSLLCSPPLALPADEDAVNVSMEPNGMLKIALADDEGREMVMKLAISTDTEPCGAKELMDELPLQVQAGGGEIKITLHAEEADEE